MAQTPETTGRRPGMVTFAAAMMFLLGGFQLSWALTEFGNAAWLGTTAYGTYAGHLWIWGIVDLLLALVAFYAGYDILRGGQFGQVFGVIIAGFNAVRWFFMLPVVPLAAVVMIAVDALILYGLLSHAEYFGAQTQTVPAAEGQQAQLQTQALPPYSPRSGGGGSQEAAGDNVSIP